MITYTFKPCPYCGKSPIFLTETEGEDTYYICTCDDESCAGRNRDVYDSAKACADAWNGRTNDTDTQGNIPEGD